MSTTSFEGSASAPPLFSTTSILGDSSLTTSSTFSGDYSTSTSTSTSTYWKVFSSTVIGRSGKKNSMAVLLSMLRMSQAERGYLKIFKKICTCRLVSYHQLIQRQLQILWVPRIVRISYCVKIMSTTKSRVDFQICTHSRMSLSQADDPSLWRTALEAQRVHYWTEI